MKVILIAGLPGSGKSCHALTLARQYGVPTTLVLDDPKTSDEIQEALARPGLETLIITDPMLCRSDIRDAALVLLDGHSIEFVYFANDTEQCLRNASGRSSKEVSGLIRHLSGLYEIPPHAIQIPVYTPEGV